MGGRDPVAVPAAAYAEWAAEIRPFLEALAIGGQFTASDFEAQIMARARQAWLIPGECLLLTQVSGDRLSTVTLTHCTGQGMAGWVAFFPMIESWAREIGAKRIEAVARPGWERVLRGFEMKKTHVVLEKRL
jgi:hypothetical protein